MRQELVCTTVLGSGQDHIPMAFLNLLDQFVTLKPWKLVGNAMQLEEVLMDVGSEATCSSGLTDINPSGSNILSPEEKDSSPLMDINPSDSYQIRAVDIDQAHLGGRSEVPEHLRSLWERSCDNLTAAEAQQLAQLLSTYADALFRT